MNESGSKDKKYCSICGRALPNPGFASNYPNLVCDDCDDRAQSVSGGFANRPMNRPYDNPVYIDGCQCWRRYRFGGHITLRDGFSCYTLSEFYERHTTDSGPLQIFTGRTPPSAQEYAERYELQRVNHDADFTVQTWGIVLDGEVFATNPVAEEAFGPLKERLSRTVDNYPIEKPLENPWFMLDRYRSFGSQAHRARVLYYHPLLERPLIGGDQPFLAIVQALEEQYPAGPIYRLENIPTERVSDLDGDGSVLTLGYSVARRSDLGPLKKRLVDGVVDILDELAAVQDRTLNGLDGRYNGVAVSVMRHQREIWATVIDTETLLETKWTEVESDTFHRIAPVVRSELSE